MKYYLVKTQPRQKGDYGGVKYRMNYIIEVEDDFLVDTFALAHAVHSQLQEPYYILFEELYKEPTEEVTNIRISFLGKEELKKELQNIKNNYDFNKTSFVKNLKRLDDKQDGGAPLEIISSDKTIETLLKELDEIEKQERELEREKERKDIIRKLRKIDKAELAKIILEATQY